MIGVNDNDGEDGDGEDGEDVDGSDDKGGSGAKADERGKESEAEPSVEMRSRSASLS